MEGRCLNMDNRYGKPMRPSARRTAIRMIPAGMAVLAFLLIAAILAAPPSTVLAEEETSFTVDAVTSRVKVGDEVTVTVNARDMNDVYGYELRLLYDPDVLRFLGASSSWEGFTVPPIIEDKAIVLAHTKIGKVGGESGSGELATLRFEAVAYGETSVRLARVKLVDSQVNSTTDTPQAALQVRIAPLAPIFSDIEDHWAEFAILRAERMGLINGYPDGRFGPQDIVTRAQFTTMLSRALSLAGPEHAGLAYLDADEIPDFARVHVSRVTAAGIVKGFPDGTFGPQRPISREEITVMIMRVAGYDEKAGAGKPLPYRDAHLIGDWAYPAVAAATELGLVQGIGGNRFAPQGITTRAEAVVLILRLLDHLNQQEP